MVNTDPNYIAPITTDTRGNPLTGAVIQNYDPNAPIGSSATMTYPNAPSSNLTTAADSTPPAVITSDPARTQVTQAVTGLNDELTKMGTGYATGDPNAQKTTTTETKQPTDTATTSTQIQPTGDPQFDQYVKSQNESVANLATQYNDFKTQSDAVRAKLNISTQNLVSSIQQSFERQIADTKKVNDATLAGLTLSGIRAGRNRYEMDTEDTGLANEMRAGIARISDLQAKRDSLIADAQVAQTKEDWQMLYQNWQEASKTSAEMNQAVVDMYKTRQENEKLAATTVQNKLTNMKTVQDVNLKTVDSIGYLAMNMLTGNKDQDTQAIQSLAAQYGVDPNTILSKVQELQAKAEPKYTGTVGEYQFYADQTRQTGGTPVDFTTWQRQQAMLTKVPETRTTTDEYGNVSTSTTSYGSGGGGGGSTSSTPKPTSSTAPTSSVNPAAVTSKDPRAKAVKVALNALGPQLTKDQAGRTLRTINGYLASGDIDNAKNTLLSIAISSLPATEQSKAFGRNVALDELDRIQGLLKDYEAKGGKTNLLKGSEEQIFQKLGSTSDPALASLGNAIKNSIIQYRNAVSGAAFTESEAKQYESMFPSAKKNSELNMALINSLRDAFKNNQSSVLSTALGGRPNYDALSAAAPVAKVTSKGITVGGKTYEVGAIVTNSKGQKGKVNADGTISLIH